MAATEKNLAGNVLTVDFPDFGPVTEAVRAKNLGRSFRGSVRIDQGRYRTDREEASRREESIATPLP